MPDHSRFKQYIEARLVKVRHVLKSASHSAAVISICLMGLLLETLLELPFRMVMLLSSRRHQ